MIDTNSRRRDVIRGGKEEVHRHENTKKPRPCSLRQQTPYVVLYPRHKKKGPFLISRLSGIGSGCCRIIAVVTFHFLVTFFSWFSLSRLPFRNAFVNPVSPILSPFFISTWLPMAAGPSSRPAPDMDGMSTHRHWPRFR